MQSPPTLPPPPPPQNLEHAPWLQANRLSINTLKCTYMITGSLYNLCHEHYIPDIKISGKSVERVYEFDQLGVTIDDKLNWTRHIEKLYKKLSSALFSMKQIKFLPKSSSVTTDRSLVDQDCVTAMLSGEIVTSLSLRSYNASKTEPCN